MILSEAELLTQALKQQFSRSVAVVLAHILHHEQLEGGVEIVGQRWRYRTVEEISSRVGYGLRSVSRAIAELDGLGLIARRTIWDPRYPGKRVGAFRALPPAVAIFEDAQAHREQRRNRTRKHGSSVEAASAAPKSTSTRHRNCQSDRFTYSQPDIERNNELVTLPLPARENQFKLLPDNDLQEEVLTVTFQGYLDVSHRLKQQPKAVAKAFWKCLEIAINQTNLNLISI